MLRSALVSAIVAAAFATVHATPAVAGSSTPKCSTSGLAVWLDTNGDGAAGTIFYKLELTNLSGHTCTLTGFPGVSAVKLNGGRLGSPAWRDHATAVRRISIPNGDTATATLGIVQAGNYPRARCGPTTAAGLRVYPPDETAAKIVPFPFRACARAGPVVLKVRPVT